MKIKEVVITKGLKETRAIYNPNNPRSPDYQSIEVSRSYTLEYPTSEEIEKMALRVANEVRQDIERDLADEIKDFVEKEVKDGKQRLGEDN